MKLFRVRLCCSSKSIFGAFLSFRITIDVRRQRLREIDEWCTGNRRPNRH